MSDIERARLESIARKHAADWAGLLKRHPAQGRSILAKVLRAKLEFKPERQRGKPGVRFSAPASIVPLLTGLVPVFHERVRPQRDVTGCGHAKYRMSVRRPSGATLCGRPDTATNGVGAERGGGCGAGSPEGFRRPRRRRRHARSRGQGPSGGRNGGEVAEGTLSTHGVRRASQG